MTEPIRDALCIPSVCETQCGAGVSEQMRVETWNVISLAERGEVSRRTVRKHWRVLAVNGEDPAGEARGCLLFLIGFQQLR